MSETDEVDAAIKSLFTVRDSYLMEDGSKEYSVVYDDKSKAAFRSLYEKVKPLGYVPHLFGSRENASLTVTKPPAPSGPAPRAMVLLALLSLVSIVGAGWFLGVSYAQVFGGSALVDGSSFVIGVGVILLSHEAVRRFFAHRGGQVSTVPYYLPNIPVFLALPIIYFLPTFGAVTFLRSPAIDKDRLFDIYLWGSVVAAFVTLGVAMAGVPSTIVLTHAQYVSIFGSGAVGVLSHNASILQNLATDVVSALGYYPSVPSGGVVFLSPISTAAWVGFLICFFSLMPAALFDGGRMATLVLGERGSRITTLVMALLLVAVDSPNYWIVFLVVFLLAAIRPSSESLDSISGISSSRKVLFLLALVLVLLCIPIPQTFFTVPL